MDREIERGQYCYHISLFNADVDDLIVVSMYEPAMFCVCSSEARRVWMIYYPAAVQLFSNGSHRHQTKIYPSLPPSQPEQNNFIIFI